jgi:hypothetical protein
VVIIGDGGITHGPEADRAFADARATNVRLSVVNVRGRTVWPALARAATRTSGVVVEAVDEAESAARGRSIAELEERIARLFAPDVVPRVEIVSGSGRTVLGALTAGEQLVFEGVIPRGRLSFVGMGSVRSTNSEPARARALAGLATGRSVPLFAIDARDTAPTTRDSDGACTDERGPARRSGGVSTDSAPVALVEPRTCAPRGAPTATPIRRTDEDSGRGVPAETVLRMLRQRVQPVARQCFRRDRRGRLDYAVRAEFIIRLEDRELSEARVDGEIDADLRTCLLTAAHDLDVPRFSGAVLVRYPLYTERAARPPVIELVPDVARTVDAVIPREDDAVP